jgi:glycerophosphoryl diester phosphodiesterase
VASFSDRRASRVRAALGPKLATGAGRASVTRLVVAKTLTVRGRRIRVRCAAAAAQVPVQSRGIPIVDAAFLRVCHDAGIAVHVWTIDDQPEMERLLDLGVDGIMTDRPSSLKQVLERRGQWS